MVAVEIKKGKNPFIFDGGIGRITMLVTILIIFTIAFGIFMAGALYAQEVSELFLRTRILPCALVFSLVLTYIMAVTYIKRLYHIIADKRKAVFYIVALYIGITALALTPVTLAKILGNLIQFASLIALVALPGKSKLC